MDPRNHVSDRGDDRTNPFAAATGDKTAMWPFVKLLWTLVPNWSPICGMVKYALQLVSSLKL